MSHFTVLVVGENPEEQLAPYEEQTEDPDLLTFEDIEDEYKRKYEADSTEKLQNAAGELFSPWDDMFRKPGEFGIGSGTHYVPEGYQKVNIPLKQAYTTFESYMEEYCGYKRDPDKGRYGYFYNPNAKWDWYSLGGRWTGFFKLKENREGEVGRAGLMTDEAKEGFVDSALKGDIDFEGMMLAAMAEADKTWEKAQADDPNKWQFWYGIQPGDTKEAYVKRHTGLTTFAILKDGQWYEKGKMGWFGMAHNEKEEQQWEEEYAKLIKGLPDDTLLSIYDCHI